MRHPHIFHLATVSLFSVACSSTIPSRSDVRLDAGVEMDANVVVEPDASTSSPMRSLRITPGQGFLGIGESLALEVTLLDSEGGEITMEGTPEWSVSDSAVATVSSEGEVTAVGAGVVELQAQLDAADTATVRLDVYGDLSACCELSQAESLTSFCGVTPGTAACPMTLAGGACDPDGDGDYDEVDGATMEAMDSFYAGQCDEEVCVIDPVPNVATDCSADFDPVNRKWRCVELTTDFPGTQVSQVCKDLGAGPRWYTYNLTPLDCCACDLSTSTVGEVPSSCVCTGNGCF